MPYDPMIEDAMYEAWIEAEREKAEEFEERFEEKISEYTRDNLRSSFSNVGVYISKVTTLIQLSMGLMEAEFYSHSVIASHTAIECTIRDLIIRPLFLGVVMDEELAEVISEIILHDKTTKYDKVVTFVVREFSGIGLESYETFGGRQLWSGIKSREKRNAAVHQGDVLSEEDAKEALDLAQTLFESVYAQLLYGLNLDEIAEKIEGVNDR